MVTLDQYVGVHSKSVDWTQERKENAVKLLSSVNKILDAYVESGGNLKKNPSTKSNISGQTFGGFRPQSCTQGSAHSSHKEGMAVDVYDVSGDLDKWCMKKENLALIESCGIYFEHPTATIGWCHMTTRAPGSGNRWFYP